MIYLDMDVHKDSITIAVLPASARAPTRLATIAAVALLLCAASAGAQTIRGVVVRPADGVGIAGVVVLLIDRSGGVVARALTNERGEYRVAASASGVYHIRTLRIGFRPMTSDAIDLRDGQELSQRLSLASVPFLMDTVRVVGANSCRVRADTAAATYAIWEQVRTALTATEISSANRSLRATVVTYDRTLDADGRRVRTQSSRLRTSLAARPWIARSRENLRRHGYVVDDADGGKTYFAPDLDELLSDAFLDDHCFRVAQQRDPIRIGLEFEPARERSHLPDIRGTVWLSRTTSELERLEFRYANVSRAQEMGAAGGEVAFTRMANGAWAISRWSIRMPVLAQRATGGFNGASRTLELEVAELKISGGDLALMTSGRDTIWARAPLVLAGTITDSVTRRPMPGARVALVGTTLLGSSDAEGRFAVSGVLPGEYIVEVRTALLDAVGAAHQSALTFTDGVTPVTIRVPPPRQVAATLCVGTTLGGDEGIILGRVSVRGDTIPPKHMKVRAEWTRVGYDIAASGGKPNRWVEALSDSGGNYRLCGVPLHASLVVRVVSDSATGDPVSIQITNGVMGRADLIVDRMIARVPR